MSISALTSSRQQRGAVLVVSMLLLTIVTLLALNASQSTRWQERTAGEQRDYDLAFQSAEAALRAGERTIDDGTMTAPPMPCSPATSPPCFLESDAWWAAHAQRYSGTTTNLIAGQSGDGLAKSDPQFYIEQIEEVPDALSVPPTGPPPSRVYYRVLARGTGGTNRAQVVLISTYVRRFN